MGQIDANALRAESRVPALGERLSVGLRGVLSRVERATGTLADAASRGRGRAADAAGQLRRSAALRHGLAAGERGNLDAALALLREAVALEPHDETAVIALWNVALSCGQAEVAAPAMAVWIHVEASGGHLRAAVERWIELGQEAPEQRVDVPTLVRMLPELRRRLAEAEGAEARAESEADLLRALHQSVEPGARGLTPGLALRVFDQARFFDVDAARRAGEIVLAAPDLHDAKRRNVEALLAKLDVDASAAAARDCAPHDGPAADVGEPAAADRRTIEAVPVELNERGLIVREVDSGQRTRIDLRAVEAVALARIGAETGASSLLIDLVLRRTPRARSERVVRMRADAFDARAVFEEASDENPLRGLVDALLDRSGALALRAPGSALAAEPESFTSIAEYEQRVLSRLRRSHGAPTDA